MSRLAPIPAWTRGTVFKTAMHYPRHFFTFKGARSAWTESVDVLFEEMDSAGIKYGVLVGRASAGAGNLGGVENREIVEAVTTYSDRFLGFLGIDLDNIEQGLAEADIPGEKPPIRQGELEFRRVTPDRSAIANREVLGQEHVAHVQRLPIRRRRLLPPAFPASDAGLDVEGAREIHIRILPVCSP